MKVNFSVKIVRVLLFLLLVLVPFKVLAAEWVGYDYPATSSNNKPGSFPEFVQNSYPTYTFFGFTGSTYNSIDIMMLASNEGETVENIDEDFTSTINAYGYSSFRRRVYCLEENNHLPYTASIGSRVVTSYGYKYSNTISEGRACIFNDVCKTGDNDYFWDGSEFNWDNNNNSKDSMPEGNKQCDYEVVQYVHNTANSTKTCATINEGSNCGEYINETTSRKAVDDNSTISLSGGENFEVVGNYYVSKPITVSMTKSITSYTPAVSIGDVYSTVSSTESLKNTNTSSDTLIIKVPISSVSDDLDVQLTVTANYETTCSYKSWGFLVYKPIVARPTGLNKDLQDIAVPISTSFEDVQDFEKSATMKLTINKEKTGKIVVNKVNSANKVITSPSKFKLYSDSSCQTVAKNSSGIEVQECTTSGGVCVFDNLRVNTYYIKETQAPTNYEVNENNCIIASLTAEKLQIPVNISNVIKKGQVTIYKRDSSNNDNATNTIKTPTTFNFYSGDSCSGTPKKYETNANGIILIENLDYGKYSIEEVTAPSGYSINTGCQNIEVNSNNKSFDFFNSPLIEGSVKLIINKRSESNALTTAIAGFTLYSDSSCTVKAVGANDSTLIEQRTNKGVATFSNLKPDTTYYVKETTVPSGYIGSSKCHEVKTNGLEKTSATLEIVNFKPNIIISKINGLDKKTEIIGAVIEVYDSNNDLIKSITSSKESVDLQAGTYRIVEISAPSGYTKYEKDILVEVTEEGKIVLKSNVDEDNFLFASVNNKGSLSIFNYPITKVDISLTKKIKDKDDVIPDIEFKFYSCFGECDSDMNNNTLISTLKTAENGKIQFKDLTYNQNYCIIESKTDDKYEQNLDPICFYVNDSNKIVLNDDYGDYAKADDLDLIVFNSLVIVKDLGGSIKIITIVLGIILIGAGSYFVILPNIKWRKFK